MVNRNAWNAYHRPEPSSPWTWIASGPTYGEANSAALLKRPDGEIVVMFGRCLPDDDGRPLPLRRRF